MSLVIQLDDAILKALKESPVFEIKGRYGTYVAVQNPWKEPVTLKKDDRTLADLKNATDWLVAPANFFGMPIVEVFPETHWAETSRPFSLNQSGLNPSAEQGNMYSTGGAPAVYPKTGAAEGTGPAVAGLILIAFAALPFASLVGSILSIFALSKARKTNNSTNRTLSIIGISINGALLILSILFYSSLISGIFTTMSDQHTGFHATTPNTKNVVPAWWVNDNTKILFVADSAQPNFTNVTLDRYCNNPFLGANYSNMSTHVNSDAMPSLAEQYRSGLQKLYPNSYVRATQYKDYQGVSYYQVFSNQELVKPGMPEVTVTIKPDSTRLYTRAACS